MKRIKINHSCRYIYHFYGFYGFGKPRYPSWEATNTVARAFLEDDDFPNFSGWDMLVSWTVYHGNPHS